MVFFKGNAFLLFAFRAFVKGIKLGCGNTSGKEFEKL